MTFSPVFIARTKRSKIRKKGNFFQGICQKCNSDRKQAPLLCSKSLLKSALRPSKRETCPEIGHFGLDNSGNDDDDDVGALI